MHCCGNPLHDAAANLPVLASLLAPALGFLRFWTRPKRCSHQHTGHKS